MEFTDNEIQEILSKHVKLKEYKREYYKRRYKEDPIHRDKVKQRSKEYYDKNKEEIKENYKKQKDFIKFKRNLRYAKGVKKLEEFNIKYNKECEMYLDADGNIKV
jgi:hypothetical protein